MKPQLQLRLGQQLAMTPQLQKAIRLLQLSAQELHQEMQVALESNPLLELDEASQSQEQNAGTLMDSGSDPEASWQESSYTSWKKGSRVSDDDTLDPTVENALCHEGNLQDYLLWQMHLTPFSDAERQIATYLIDAINDDGFIAAPFSELSDTIQKQLSVSEKAIFIVLKKMQTFDPIGVAARDLQECLSIQLSQFPASNPLIALAQQTVNHYWSLIAKRDLNTLKKRLKTPDKTFTEVMQLIQSCHPRPGTEIGSKAPRFELPDLYATLTNKRWHVALNPMSVPNLKISSLYRNKMSAQTAHDQRYIKQQMQEAQWFIQSIEHRNQTLLSVANYLVQFQAPFLTLGDEALKPLDLSQVADQLNIHESTVSRITMHKTIDTPRGLLELKAFFSNPMLMKQGESCSAKAIRALLKKLIASEDPKKPFSDARLTQMLQTQGIQVARRTIAKYRESLRIPAAHERKQVF